MEGAGGGALGEDVAQLNRAEAGITRLRLVLGTGGSLSAATAARSSSASGSGAVGAILMMKLRRLGCSLLSTL